MSRPGVDYETVKHTAIKLLSQGIAPSVQKIREELGTGSNTTIADHLKVWRDEYTKKTIHHLPANMPKELISTFEVLWQTAMEHAHNQLAEYKKVVESEHEAALQKEKEADKAVTELELKLNEVSLTLEQEIASKQKIAVELAIANDRLIKQEQAITAQKHQYEDRLKRVYEEKDNVITQCYQLQTEIKTLHEKLATQAEEQKQLLAQQNTLQEQSETRWLKLIDQARQETRDERKKSENFCQKNNEKIKIMELQLTNAQRELYENNVHLKNAQERIIQLREEGKSIEMEYTRSLAIIMRLEDELKPKAISPFPKRRNKKEKQLNKETVISNMTTQR